MLFIIEPQDDFFCFIPPSLAAKYELNFNISELVYCVSSAKCLSSLSSLPVTTQNTEYGPLLNCLCAWDRTTDVLELINEWIVDGMNAPPKDTRMVSRAE